MVTRSDSLLAMQFSFTRRHCNCYDIKTLVYGSHPQKIDVNEKYVNENFKRSNKIYENGIELIFTCTHQIKYYTAFNLRLAFRF